MKRSRSQVSREMSPGANEEGFPSRVENEEMVGVEELHGLGRDNGDNHVTVVGAGPAGLMLATNLVRFGIKTTVIDDRPDKTSTGRADGVQPKTIETFKQLGLADSLLKKGVRIYDICFWNSTALTPLRRTQREVHYPLNVVDVEDPFILLVHQGMVEDVFLQDMKARGVEVIRNRKFISHATTKSDTDACITADFETLDANKHDFFHSSYLVGCDGAHSLVRKSMSSVEMQGEPSRAAWGVLDGVIETDFPDLWSKVVISSETEGTILCIPRERNMTRLYIELHPSASSDTPSAEAKSQEFVMSRASAIMSPFKLSWNTVEWFGVYKVGQRVASKFSSDDERTFIAGDAAHTHSPKAAQGMNVSMHDGLNLAWKLNLAVRGLAKPSLLSTYEQERRKIAQDLIDFDYEHANAFSAGDPQALADNFAKNIRFISGVGAEYSQNVLNLPEQVPRGGLRAGALLSPAKVTRYIDANPVDLQLDIPMFGQFRIFFFVQDIKSVSPFLNKVCEDITSPKTNMGRSSAAAEKSYAALLPRHTEMDEFVQPQRYTAVSKIFTFAMVTTMPKADVEIADLPKALQDSRWTFYLDDVMQPSCTEKWLGNLGIEEVAIVNVRPDGYVGSIGRFHAINVGASEAAVAWLNAYYEGFLKD